MPVSSKGKMGYIGRLAPSPTGLLHLGHVRTFAVAAQRARAAGGALLLRIDDLDPLRSRAEFVEAAEQDLLWLGLAWDGRPRLQSEHQAEYRAAWQKLVAGGWVYPCRCSRRDLREAVAAPHEAAPNIAEPAPAEGPDTAEPIYPGTCRPAWLPGSVDGAADRLRWLAAGPNDANWRFRVWPEAPLAWADGGLGPQQFAPGQQFGDFSVWRRDGVPAYQLATVVDDAAMSVSEVVRGADLLLSTARQLLLFRALGLSAPGWVHCPLVVDDTGRRMAKRTDALSVRTLRERGVRPDEVLAMAAEASTL